MKEALVLVQKKYILLRCQSERERARMLQRSGGSRATRHGSDALSFESCRSSVVDDMGEVSSESSKRMKDMERLKLCGPL